MTRLLAKAGSGLTQSWSQSLESEMEIRCVKDTKGLISQPNACTVLNINYTGIVPFQERKHFRCCKLAITQLSICHAFIAFDLASLGKYHLV